MKTIIIDGIEYVPKEPVTTAKDNSTKWNMKSAEWYISSDGKISSGINTEITAIQKYGMKYHTKELAERARNDMRIPNMIRYWVSVIEPEWITCWDDEMQEKWTIYYDAVDKKWGSAYMRRTNYCAPYMSEATAKTLADALNSGELVL